MLLPACRTPAEAGLFAVRSEVYPHLCSAVKVVKREEALAAAGPTSRAAAAASSHSAAAPGFPRSGSGSMSLDVEEFIRFPLLGPRPGMPMAALNSDSAAGELASRSQGTQTSSSRVSRQKSTAGAGAGGPGLVLGRFAQPPDSRPSSASSTAEGSSEGEEAAAGVQEDSLLDSPPESGLRRRGRSTSQAADAALPAPSITAMPPRQSAALDTFSALSNSNGSGVRGHLFVAPHAKFSFGGHGPMCSALMRVTAHLLTCACVHCHYCSVCSLLPSLPAAIDC